MAMPENVPLNCPVDDLLGGGLPSGLITQIYGPPGSGKSNMALQATINCTKMGLKVLFIDPEGSLSVKRLEQMQPGKEALDSVVLREPTSMAEQGKFIQEAWDINDLGLIVVDSIVYYYRLEREHDQPYQANKELGLQLATLLEIARKKHIPVLVTNQVYTNIETNTIEPVGGHIMKYSTKVIVELSQHSERYARLVKHIFMKDGQKVNFKIVEKGVI